MRKLLFCLFPALLMLVACEEGTTPDTNAPAETGGVATVNGESISETQFNSYAERRTGSDPATLEPAVREQLINELVNIALLAQVAREDRLHEQAPLKEQIEFQRETVMADAAMTRYLENNPVTEEAVRAEYEKRTAELGGTEYKARHILVEKEETANEIIAELEGGADFAELAKAHSIEPGADQSGGDLGWFSPSQMVPPFAAAVTSMQPGERSQEPVETQFGWHVIIVEDTRDVPPPAFEQVAPQIRRFLTTQRVQDYISELRSSAEVSLSTPAATTDTEGGMTMPEPEASGENSDAGQESAPEDSGETAEEQGGPEA